MNNFIFKDQHYLQIHDTAMGTKMAPSFANLFLCLFETNALNMWLRYIDDICVIWTEGLDKLRIFIDIIHPTIKFTSSHSNSCIPFLDVNRLRAVRFFSS